MLGQHLPTSMCAMHMPDSLTQAPHTQVRTTQQQFTVLHIVCGLLSVFATNFTLILYHISESIAIGNINAP